VGTQGDFGLINLSGAEYSVAALGKSDNLHTVNSKRMVDFET
jgi:hypothetical protein